MLFYSNIRLIFFLFTNSAPALYAAEDTAPLVKEERTTTQIPKNGHGYIQFEIDEELPQQTESVQKMERGKSKKETVNEVLSSLFPNGFTNIFRFSGSEINIDTTTNTPSTTSTTVNSNIIAKPNSTAGNSSLTPNNNTYYSFQTTVSKEYRRELRPGHTQIVVEKFTSPEREPFKDGSNHITRDELLRINRAAVTSPVLPSLLLQPDSGNDDNETLVAAESAPIVILGDQETDLDEVETIDDNQIAESRHMGQQYYQQNLPPISIPESKPQSSYHTIESYRNQQGPAEEQQFTVHIIHDDSMTNLQKDVNLQHGQTSNYYQANEKQHSESQEAPSRTFLKSFKPTISSSANGPISKGVFHYETNNQPQRQFFKAPKEVRLTNTLETQSPQYQQISTLDQSQQKLNTKAVASSAANAPDSSPHRDYSSFIHPTPNSLVYVTVNTPSPPLAPSISQESEKHTIPQLPTPHEYVAEATAEPSQRYVQQAPAPATKSDSYSYTSPQTPASAKPNGYTFVEVQKSVNIHNKLISEKDGNLVEIHETIYHPSPNQDTHLSPVYSPKNYVSSAISETKKVEPTSAKNYVSLAENPIHVEQGKYDNSPQEGEVSYETVHPASIDSHQTVYHSPVSQVHPVPVQKLNDHVVEKHVPVTYVVPQPIPVPVHVEHYVDRPYPVETFVEQPIPYPVETVVEKIVEKKVPVEVERIVEKPVEVEKIVEKYIDRPMAIPIHVPVAIRLPMPPNHSPGFNFPGKPNVFSPWQHSSIANVPPKVLQNYYIRMLKKMFPLKSSFKTDVKKSIKTVAAVKGPLPPVKPILGEAPKVATFSLADMPFDLRPPPPPRGSPWLQGARYIYNTLPSDLSTEAASSVQMVKSYIGPVPTTSTSKEKNGNEFDEFQRWRIGHSLKRSPDASLNLHMEYGFKPPLVPSIEIDDKGVPLNKEDSDVQ